MINGAIAGLVTPLGSVGAAIGGAGSAVVAAILEFVADSSSAVASS